MVVEARDGREHDERLSDLPSLQPVSQLTCRERMGSMFYICDTEYDAVAGCCWLTGVTAGPRDLLRTL